MKGQNKSWKSYSSCVNFNHCLLTFLVVISCVNYSHGFWDWVPFWSSEEDARPTVICDADEFSCDSKRLCIKTDSLCDGVDDCDDKSDELPCAIAGIFPDHLGCNKGECPRSYKRDPIPPLCAVVNNITCEYYINITCVNKLWDFNPYRYVLQNLIIYPECRNHWTNVPLIVFSTLNTLHQTILPEDRSKIHVNKMRQLNLSGISAFDYDSFNNAVIWLDKSENKIFVARFNVFSGLNEMKIHERQVAVNGTHKIHVFAYDSLNKVIFWIDDYGIRSQNLLKMFRKTQPIEQQPKLLRTLDPSYERPGSITIDVKKQCIFWMNIPVNPEVQLATPKFIERIDISGEPKTEKIVKGEFEHWDLYPVGLAIDTKNTKVYWIDGFGGTVNSVGYDGTNRTILYEDLYTTSEVISMDIFSNYLYFTDARRSINKIHRININNAVSKVDTLVSVPNGPPTWVKIIDPRVQYTNFPPILKGEAKVGSQISDRFILPKF
ncbi:low-density lipoprotein receptor-related protein 2 isoform X2 [Tetranychus urticae]|uniref:low-density lipoprotein receptor-related protein 2 isoform X2 n=1 Tax=Tetranychus urticae TaxID=32264 RepID=UPI00077BF308|nr:low-density lipoprotein receptor-related protein 2 isoform X2 [Tetranychus urticae]